MTLHRPKLVLHEVIALSLNNLLKNDTNSVVSYINTIMNNQLFTIETKFLCVLCLNPVGFDGVGFLS